MNISYKSGIALLLFYWFTKSTYTTGVECLQYDIFFVLNVFTFDLFSYCQHFKGKNEKAMTEVTEWSEIWTGSCSSKHKSLLEKNFELRTEKNACENSRLHKPIQLKKVFTIAFVATGSYLKCPMKSSSNSNVIKSHVLRQRFLFLFVFTC